MPGPYFEWQIRQQCGCYYPDVTFLRDEPTAEKRILNCIFHGEIQVPYLPGTIPTKSPGIPTEKWREAERERLRRGEKSKDRRWLYSDGPPYND